MKANTIYIVVVSILVLIGAYSCSSDFLEIRPEQNVATENAVTDLNTLRTSLNGVYSRLQYYGYYGRNVFVIPELMADNMRLSIRNTGRYLEYDGFGVNNQDVRAMELWNTGYEVIINASRALQGGEKLLEEFPDQAADINQLVGEAYALRALAHFDLVRFFAQPYNFSGEGSHPGIPIVSEVGEDQISPARNTVKEVYDQINADLATAISKMKDAKGQGTFSINAAKALAARAALYQGDYDEAVSLSSEVIGSGDHSLINHENYNDIWAVDFNDECIFEIVNTVSDNAGTNSLGHFFDPTGYADAMATDELYDLYDEDDVRRTAIVVGSKQGAEEVALFIGKFPKGTGHDDNIRVLRLAEQYLIRAEAYAQTGQEEKAREDLETIARRGNPQAESITETGAALMDRVLLERRKELAFEGHRLFDLTRNKRDVRIVQTENVTEVSYPNEKLILPVPVDEVNANPNMDQNPGY